MITLTSLGDINWFGRRLKAARESARLSQEELAERVDLTRLTIARYESGRLKPGFERLEPLASALSLPLWWFFTEDEQPPIISSRNPNEDLLQKILDRLTVLEEKAFAPLDEAYEVLRERTRNDERVQLGNAPRQALEQQRRSIIEIVQARFQELPATLSDRLQDIHDPDRLRALTLSAATAAKLADFLRDV